MLDFAYSVAYRMGEEVGCRYLFLESQPDNIPIYEACEFVATKKKRSGDSFMVRRVIPNNA